MGIVLTQSFKNTISTYLGFGLGAINTLFLYTNFLTDEYYGLVAFLLSAANIMMPFMDGYEAMRRIREQEKYRNLPIIALTAKAMAEDRIKCLEAGANDYMKKPVKTEELLALLKVSIA